MYYKEGYMELGEGVDVIMFCREKQYTLKFIKVTSRSVR